MKKPELLAPAGSFEKAKIAFLYGADAVYCGTSSLSLRTRADMENDDLIETIKKFNINKMIYVSCDPATLARDLKIMVEKGYDIKLVQPVDMFPHTSNCETITLLEKQIKKF